MIPAPTVRLRFRAMTPADLDDLAALLGDPVVMAYYPAPRTRGDAASWIERNQRRYATDGFGLWVIETHEGEFLGDCGLTWQDVNGVATLEVGYHVRADRQGRGHATEAAAACRDLARARVDTTRLVALVHPDNTASRRVAEKIGMSRAEDDHGGPIPVRTVMALTLRAPDSPPSTG